MQSFKNLQTSAPKEMATYLKVIAIQKYGTLSAMYADVLCKFIMVKPWEASPPLAWRSSKLHNSSSMVVRNIGDAGWVPINMKLPSHIAKDIEEACHRVNVNSGAEHVISMRAFLYTALYWWCVEVMEERSLAQH